jgi:hypothetical protein
MTSKHLRFLTVLTGFEAGLAINDIVWNLCARIVLSSEF